MFKNKILLKKGDCLKVGDIFLEINRFDKENYRVYKVILETKIHNDDYKWGTFKVLSVGKKVDTPIGYQCQGYLNLFDNKNCSWLCYRLPIADILYKK